MQNTRVTQDRFDPSIGFTRGASSIRMAAWYLIKMAFFLTAFPWPSAIKAHLLRIFGSKVGIGVVLKPRLNIHIPWKLEIGDHVWIGEEVLILNFEPIKIGAHACISQRAFLCGGNHDFRDPSMTYRNRPILVGDGAWIGAQVFVAPGVVIGTDAVITAGSIVTKDLPAGMICAGNPCRPVNSRWRTSG